MDEAPAPAGGDPAAALRRALEHAAHLLPAQGPISIFVHHNTLHTLEDLPFEQAVVEGGRLFGCEPFLSEERYRTELARGRIQDRDLVAVAREIPDGPVGTLCTRRELALAMLRCAIVEAQGPELEWILDETGVLSRFAAGVSGEARRTLVRGPEHGLEHEAPTPAEERAALRALWRVCLRAAGPGPAAPEPPARLPAEASAEAGPRDAAVHALLIPFCAAYLDQGVAYWPMPDRQRGFYRCFRSIHGSASGAPSRWRRELAAELRRQETLDMTAEASALESLAALGVAPERRDAFIASSMLALRGWAGMIRQFETRPDRIPIQPLPATLMDFLAVRLVTERFAPPEPPPESPAPPTPRTQAFVLFQVMQALGRLPEQIEPAVLEEVGRLDSLERRRLFHRAYERRYRIDVLDALSLHPPRPVPAPRAQAIFCIDEREESLRRHLEEAAPWFETFGAAGFFGVAMYYKGAGDPRPAPLCPVVIRPRHEVHEEVSEERRATERRRLVRRRRWGRLAEAFGVGSRTFTRGAALTLLGSIAAVPLVSRVLMPRLAGRIREHAHALLAPPEDTELKLERDPDRRPMLGEVCGFTVEEMAGIVGRLLEETGLAGRLGPWVLVVGHGSTSLNNPHESAHDCGACGGGRGGPNARAFAQMANHPRVRARLGIPDAVRFVGAYHDSCDDSIRLYDDAPPEIVEALERAVARNAQERCRRFDVPGDLTPERALAHVEARTEDLAQPRPEYGHATNAACIVGRRALTRGLFLDRRAFLVSYDSGVDPDGALLERLLSAVAPVCGGINLEYYFSYVDPSGYGCHTKLPHNIASLLGVMDGPASDLRTGLPLQMVEIHEPVRLLLVVEQQPELLLRVVDRVEAARRLVRNGWVQLAALGPAGVSEFDAATGRFVAYVPEAAALPTAETSRAWFTGRAEHLKCARLTGVP